MLQPCEDYVQYIRMYTASHCSIFYNLHLHYWYTYYTGVIVTSTWRAIYIKGVLSNPDTKYCWSTAKRYDIMRKSRFITKECIVAMHTHLIHLRKKELSCQGLISQEYVLINARHLLIPDTHVRTCSCILASQTTAISKERQHRYLCYYRVGGKRRGQVLITKISYNNWLLNKSI